VWVLHAPGRQLVAVLFSQFFSDSPERGSAFHFLR
jgi:hypothetical protein